MKKKALRGSRISNTKRRNTISTIMVKGSLANHLMVQLDQVSLNPPLQSVNPSRFQKILDSESYADSLPMNFDADASGDKDFILSQDFFW